MVDWLQSGLTLIYLRFRAEAAVRLRCGCDWRLNESCQDVKNIKPSIGGSNKHLEHACEYKYVKQV